MIDVCNYAEVAIPLDRDLSDSFFDVRRRMVRMRMSLCPGVVRCAKGACDRRSFSQSRRNGESLLDSSSP